VDAVVPVLSVEVELVPLSVVDVVVEFDACLPDLPPPFELDAVVVVVFFVEP
jgi:hypothetical protein